MSNLRTANRYAEALIVTAEEQKLRSQVSKDLRFIQSMIAESHEFKLFLKSPVIKKDKKKQVLGAVFGTTVQPLTLQFILLLADKEREDILASVIESFFQMEDESLGVRRVQITAASSLDKKQLTAMQERFADLSKKKVEMQISEDKKLLGGFIARIGDTVYDGSVLRQLELLRKKLTAEVTTE